MSASKLLRDLIKYIVTEIQDSGGVVLRTRLVKILYLCDVENYRNSRATLTGLDWVRYNYGPFAFELQDIGKHMGIDILEESVDFSSGRGFRVSVEESPDPERFLTPSQKLVIDRVLKRWGDENLDALLDYVYCDTEPMRNAQFLERLDFRKIIAGIRNAVALVDLSDADKNAIKKLVEKSEIVSRKPVIYKPTKAEKETIGDEPPSPSISGHAKHIDQNIIRMFEGRE